VKPSILEGCYRYVGGTCNYRSLRRTFTWTINLPYQTEVDVSPQSRAVYTKLHNITYRKAIIFIGEVTRSADGLFLQHTRISYLHRLLSAYSRVKWRLITLNTVICNFVTPYKDCLAVDDREANCKRELRTAFLSRLQLSLGQPFWTDFGCRLAVVLFVSVQRSRSATLFWHIQFN